MMVIKLMLLAALGVSGAMMFVQFRQIRGRDAQLRQLLKETAELQSHNNELRKRLETPSTDDLGTFGFTEGGVQIQFYQGQVIKTVIVPAWAYTKEPGNLTVGCRSSDPFWVFKAKAGGPEPKPVSKHIEPQDVK